MQATGTSERPAFAVLKGHIDWSLLIGKSLRRDEIPEFWKV